MLSLNVTAVLFCFKWAAGFLIIHVETEPRSASLAGWVLPGRLSIEKQGLKLHLKGPETIY